MHVFGRLVLMIFTISRIENQQITITEEIYESIVYPSVPRNSYSPSLSLRSSHIFWPYDLAIEVYLLPILQLVPQTSLWYSKFLRLFRIKYARPFMLCNTVRV